MEEHLVLFYFKSMKPKVSGLERGLIGDDYFANSRSKNIRSELNLVNKTESLVIQANNPILSGIPMNKVKEVQTGTDS